MVENIYAMSIKEYTHTSAITGELCTVKACISITKAQYDTLKSEGLPTKDYYEVIFGAENSPNVEIIRQVLYKHVVYVDKADHTNY